MSEALVLDPCCGSRMMWLDKSDPRAIFGDRRRETIVVTDRSHKEDGTRTLTIEPDALMDFRALPFPDGRFRLIAFDPPHLERAGPRSWLAAKYGKLSDNWRDDLRAGFAECFRVLEPHGVLIFKWNEAQVKLREVLELTPEQPMFGQISGRSGMTHWLVFMKPDAAPQTSAKEGETDMRAVCEALGFDPSNHHNALKCPYCNPGHLSIAALKGTTPGGEGAA